MPPSKQRAPERRWRKYFRRTRICVLLLILCLVGALAYLNQIGLPEFLRQPLQQKLRERGLDLQFSNLRLHFYRGIVADDVKFGRTNDTTGVRVTAREADLNIGFAALLKFQLYITGVGIRDGRVIFPVTDTNQPGRTLAVDRIRVDLRFQEGDQWALEDLHAVFHGADFSLAGSITNATAVRQWPFLRGKERTGPSNFEQRLRKLADTLDKIHFTTPPEMRAVFSGDARDLESFTMRLTVIAPDAVTPWGKFTQSVLTAKLLPAAPIERRRGEIQLQSANAETPWANVSRFSLGLQMRSLETDTNLVNANVVLKAAYAMTVWANVTNVHFTADWVHSLTNPVPLSGHGELRADAAKSLWASARTLHLTADLAPPTNAPAADASWAWWQTLQPYALGWTAHAARVDTTKLRGDDVAFAGNWNAPLLQITNLHVRFPDGDLYTSAKLDILTRQASFDLKSDFDAHRISPVLTPDAARWLAKYTWRTPPHVSGSGTITLPAWTNRDPDWRAVGDSLKLSAYLTGTNCAYLGVPVDWVRTHISYTNLIWRLPDLVASRPEGKLQLQHIANDRTHEYWFGIQSTLSPNALRPLLSTNAQRGLDFFKFSQSPTINGGVWGRWRDVSSIGATARVSLVNFSFRDQTASRFDTSLRYTNLFLECFDPRLMRGTQAVTSSGITADFKTQRIYFTNTVSSAEPMVIARCIGPKTAEALEPYKFAIPPLVRVNGYAPLKGDLDADLRFDVDGGPFEWWKFDIPHISGRVHWRGDQLTLTNIQISAYDGTASGVAGFNFRPTRGTDFYFAVAVRNADMYLLMSDVTDRTNNPEGRLSGDLTVSRANTENTFTWNGFGNVQLRDGLIWAIPVFGALSKPLDSLASGLGSTRITEGSGQFMITNGVIFSDNLEMKSQMSRLQLNGTVDLEGHINARVTAIPLREAFGIGVILRVPLWPLSKLFEYHLSGTLGAPKAEPVYVPKLILHPFQTVEGIFSNEGKTNSSPNFKEQR